MQIWTLVEIQKYKYSLNSKSRSSDCCILSGRKVRRSGIIKIMKPQLSLASPLTFTTHASILNLDKIKIRNLNYQKSKISLNYP